MKAVYIIQDRSGGEGAFREANVAASSPEVALSKAKALLGTNNELFIMRAIEWEVTISRSAQTLEADMKLDEE